MLICVVCLEILDAWIRATLLTLGGVLKSHLKMLVSALKKKPVMGKSRNEMREYNEMPA